MLAFTAILQGDDGAKVEAEEAFPHSAFSTTTTEAFFVLGDLNGFGLWQKTTNNSNNGESIGFGGGSFGNKVKSHLIVGTMELGIELLCVAFNNKSKFRFAHWNHSSTDVVARE